MITTLPEAMATFFTALALFIAFSLWCDWLEEDD